ncbi:DUF732 domain-containing protein [Mycobacterium novum]
MFRKTLMAAAAAALFAAPTAQADEASYIQHVNENNLRIPLWSDGQLYGAGVKICGFLRDGMSPQQLSDAQGYSPFMDNMGLIRAAQENICPDTL